MLLDAVVIGAGPAGATAARDLAHSGARVALVDGSHPREKPCGGGVTGRALELAGTAIPGGCATDAVTFEAAGRRATISLPQTGYLRVFSREIFDAALVRQAVDGGSDLVRSRVRSIARAAGRLTIEAGEPALATPPPPRADGARRVLRERGAPR